MSVDKSYARLGFFLLLSLVVVLITAVFFIQRWRAREVIEAVTYTRDNVSGLDVSSPVRFGGLTVGRVADLRLSDPEGRFIEVDFEVFLDRVTDLGGDPERLQQIATEFTRRLRAQVIGNPVTGEAYLLLTQPTDPPPAPSLDFTPDRPYVPAMPAPLTAVRDRLPEFIEQAENQLRTFGEIVSRIPDSLDRADRFFTSVEQSIRESELPALSADSRTFFASTTAQIEHMTSELEKVIGPAGTIAELVEDARAAIKASDLPGTTESTRDAANATVLAAEDLRRSLPAIRDSLEQLRELARMLEDQPESLVYGRRPPGGEKR